MQDTPIAIRAIGGADLTKAQVTDVSGLQRLAPDLGITPDSVFTKIAIRGVSSQDISESADPALTVSIDGEYINRPVGLNANFFDLERIEVLRGPQGTLFGRNSTAGALNIVAAKPVLQSFEGSATAGYGNYDAIYATGAVNVPLGDTVAIRVAGLHNQHDGYVDNGPAGAVTMPMSMRFAAASCSRRGHWRSILPVNMSTSTRPGRCNMVWRSTGRRRV
ncbi:Colicin I receptor precursor [Sphingomonas paucimobilis]|nr:Colicin I receptor precursor [Sphingomonas paucimobilis]